MKKQFKTSTIQELFFSHEEGEVFEGLKFIEKSDWVSGGKYETCEFVFWEVTTGKYYLYYAGRSGSYYTDYVYDFEFADTMLDCFEAVKKEKVSYSWEKVND